MPNVYLAFNPKICTECLKIKEKAKLFDFFNAI